MNRRRRSTYVALIVAMAMLICIVGTLPQAQAAARRPICLRVWSYQLRRYVTMCPCPTGWGSIATCQIYRAAPSRGYSR